MKKNLIEHIMDGNSRGGYSHIDLTLRSGGLHERVVYNMIQKFIERGIIKRTSGGKFIHAIKYKRNK